MTTPDAVYRQLARRTLASMKRRKIEEERRSRKQVSQEKVSKKVIRSAVRFKPLKPLKPLTVEDLTIALPLVTFAFETLGLPYRETGKLGRAVLKLVMNRKREGATNEELRTVIRWAKSELDRGSRFLQYRNPAYLWGNLFPVFLASANASVKLHQGYVRTGAALNEVIAADVAKLKEKLQVLREGKIQ